MPETVRIVVVDDEDSVRKRCVRLLAKRGFQAVGATDGTVALEMVRRNVCDIMLVDIRMPGMDGIKLLEHVKASNPHVEVIMMTGYAAVDSAVKAMKCGACDYLTKPFELDQLLQAVRAVVARKCLVDEGPESRGRPLPDSHDDSMLVGDSQVMQDVRRFIDKVAPVDCNVVLYGESGTGKGLVTKCIHAASRRSEHPFVVADCAALSGALLESELFGHVRGAFTDAYSDRKGYFETAHRGTIFLDEIGELPLDLQGKLLRAVEENIVYRLGSSDPIRVDVRVIASTNRNLQELVQRRLFREDLFFRLNVVSFTIPPIRERPEDVPLLVGHFLKRYGERFTMRTVPTVAPETLDIISAYHWPGNVRELENAVQRALVLAENDELSMGHLLPVKAITAAGWVAEPGTGGQGFRAARKRAVEEFTRRYLETCLRRNQGNVTRTAKELDMRRTSLQRLLKQAGLDPRGYRTEVPHDERRAS